MINRRIEKIKQERGVVHDELFFKRTIVLVASLEKKDMYLLDKAGSIFLFCVLFVISLSFRNPVYSLFISRNHLRSFNKKKIESKIMKILSILPCINKSCQKKKKAKNVSLHPSPIALFGEFFCFFLPFPREISFFFFSFNSLFLLIIMLYTERLVVLLYRK